MPMPKSVKKDFSDIDNFDISEESNVGFSDITLKEFYENYKCDDSRINVSHMPMKQFFDKLRKEYD